MDYQYDLYCAELHLHMAVRRGVRPDHIVSTTRILLDYSELQVYSWAPHSFVFMCGIGSGGFFALQSAIVGQILGSHRVNAGISWLELCGSLGYLAGPISAGALLDAFGGADNGAAPYRPAMVSQSPSTVRVWSALKSLWILPPCSTWSAGALGLQ
jgi:MFS family permease